MKYFSILISILIASCMLTACASTSRTLDEKYLFPDLEQVDHFRSYKIDGWGNIDKQSLIVSESPKTSYLIILKQPHSDLKFAQGIKFSSSGSTVYAKFDRIEIIDNDTGVQPLPAYIERIYKLNSREDKKMVRAQILGKTTENTDETMKSSDIPETEADDTPTE